MTITQKISGAVAGAGLFAFACVPAAFAAGNVDVTVDGNGYKSDTNVHIGVSDEQTVVQESLTASTVVVYTSANTGGNNVSGNTGNSEDNTFKVTTGDATSTTSVKVVGGGNVAYLDSCGCDGHTTVDVSNNGARSDQDVVIHLKNKKQALQSSLVESSASIVTKAQTGKSKVKNNTGGSASVTTGNGSSSSTTVVKGGMNLLNPSL